jgi:hypothetical protein
MASPSFSVPPPDDRITINCLYCGKPIEIGRRAMSVVCQFCHKPLKLDDWPIKGYEARTNVDTCGVVTVEKKGSAIVSRILCGGAVVRGKVKGAIISRGPVLVGPEAEIKGDVSAPALAVGSGAILEGHYEIGTPQSQQPVKNR